MINKGLEQLCRKVDYEKDWLKHVRTNWIEYEYNVVINADWDGLMCIDWIEIFVRIFLISPHLKIRVCWKDVLPRPVNNIFIFPKNFYLAFAQTYLTQIPLGPQAVSEWCCIAHFTLFTLSTSGTSVLFTKSVKSINITAHILQYVTLMNQNTSQHFSPVPLQHHFHTRYCNSQTLWSELKVANVLMHWYIFIYISYHKFNFSVFEGGKRVRLTFNSLLSCKGANMRVLK